MFKFVCTVWLLLPVVVLVWHFGPGQRHWKRNESGAYMRAAETAAAEKDPDWQAIADAYAHAHTCMPVDELSEQRRLILAEASARIKAGDITAGQQLMENLIAEIEFVPNDDVEIEASARYELARASYFAAWLLRLEGATREEWEPEVDVALDQFRRLAENSLELVLNTPGGRRSTAHRQFAIFTRNLEAAAILRRLYLPLLLDRELPADCPPGENLRQSKRVHERRNSQNS